MKAHNTTASTRAFTLTEILCVIAIIAIAAGVFGGTSWHVQSSMHLRNTAAEFLQTVKTARQFAVDYRCRTRVAFRAGLWSTEPDTAANESLRTYRIFAFIVPTSSPGDAGAWVEVHGQRADSQGVRPVETKEWARTGLTPRPKGLVGRWLVCPLDGKPRHVADSVKIASPLFTRFRDSDAHTYFAENFHTPDATWALATADPHEPRNCFSVFPADYCATPADDGPVLFSGELPEDEECLDPLTGDIVPARAFWPGHVQFIRGVNTENSEEAPAIEFQPDGSLPLAWTRELEFTFARTGGGTPDFTVLIDAATGLSRIETPQIK